MAKKTTAINTHLELTPALERQLAPSTKSRGSPLDHVEVWRRCAARQQRTYPKGS